MVKFKNIAKQNENFYFEKSGNPSPIFPQNCTLTWYLNNFGFLK